MVLCYKKPFDGGSPETVPQSVCTERNLNRKEGGRMRGKNEPIQLICPKCRYEMIVYLPLEDLPMCPECKETRMVIEELLDEGKSY